MTRLQRLTMPMLVFASLALGAIAMSACLYLGEARAAAAHLAAADPVAAQPVAAIDWTFWIALASLLLSLASHALHFIAPRTKTKVDDEWMGRVDTMLGWWQTAAPKPADKPTLTIAPPSPDKPASDNVVGVARGGIVGAGPGGTVAMLAVLLLGALAAPALTGCATTKHAVAEGGVAFLECEGAHVDAQELAQWKAAASIELRHLLTGSAGPDWARLKEDLAPLKTDAARCGWAAAIAAIGALFPQPSDPEGGVAVSALVAAGPDPAQIRDQARLVMRDLGWPRIKPSKAPDGPVL